MNYLAIIEGLLFLRGDEGISIPELRDILGVKDEVLRSSILNLQENYLSDSRGIKLEKFGDNLKLATKREHKDFYQRLVELDDSKPLTGANLETLAIVAYNEPLTRGEVDDIRGVNCAHLIRNLVNRELIEVKGKSEKPGKPNLYGTTPKFLDVFGLNSLEDLPELAEVELAENEETNLFESKYKED